MPYSASRDRRKRLAPPRRRPWVLIGGSLGLTLAMPLFEISLLTALVVDGMWLRTGHVVQYFARSSTLILILLIIHVATCLIGALVGWIYSRFYRRRRLRVIPGGRIDSVHSRR